MMARAKVVACGIAGLAIAAVIFLPPVWRRVRRGDNDFQVSYVSGQLMASRQLYNDAVVLEAERRISGSIYPDLRDTRLPFLALLFWPVSRLPYQIAWPVWSAVLIAAIAGFVWLWPDRRAAALACCWSGSVVVALANGQDLILLLLWMAIALRIRDKRPFLAGLVLALCAAKFHLFVFLPLLLWRHRLWRGFVAGAAGLVAISFAVAGWRWPVEYAATLAAEETVAQAHTTIMPNLHGLAALWPHADTFELLATLLIAAAVILIIWRADFPAGMAAVLTGGLLVSRHAYMQDCALLLPALLILLRTARGPALLLFAWLLSPLSGLAILAGHPAGDITRLAMLALLGYMVVQHLPARQAYQEAHAI